MRFEIKATSDVGCVRAHNEDMILVGDEVLRDSSAKFEFASDGIGQPYLIAVADGMGGHKGGAYASELVLSEMCKAIKDIPPGMSLPELKVALKEKIRLVHSVVNDEGIINSEKSGMGSTFIGLLSYNDSIFYINVGDSRMYRFRDGILSQFSRDHSLTAMTNDPDAPKNVLVNSFGAGANIFFDLEDITNRIISDDILLLCSDGLTTELTDHEIEIVLGVYADPEMLVDAAKNKEGSDNISVILVKFI